jgi:NAD(P)-dependent dehydrogenase (short-subunit alcohol dehydrogenase family)
VKVDAASAASWNESLSANLMSYTFCAKAAVPLMRRDVTAMPRLCHLRSWPCMSK